jgi:3',5'-cyclic AMP phosphodiesterase CpdA
MEPFTFIQITDHHLMETEAMLSRGYSPSHAFRRTIRHIATHHPDADFIVSTGDLVDRGIAAEYATFRAILGLRETSPAPGPQRATGEGLAEMPMYFLPGNHDPRDAFFAGMFPGTPGPPTAMNAAFTHKGIRFACIDWGASNRAATTEEMLDHLAATLADGLPTIVLSHHNVTPVGLPRLDALAAPDIDRFADVIAGRPILAILHGHTHLTVETALAGIPVLGLRSTHFSFAQSGDEFLYVLRPPQYRVVRVAGTTLTSETVEVPL